MISPIYNPSGILTPALLKPKKIIQDLWKDKIDWDKTIPHQLLAQWNAWKQDLENITKISLNRWHMTLNCMPTVTHLQLRIEL